MASHPIYQFYAELDDYEPKIWRRFQVTDNITVARLGYIIQVLFEMTASHLMTIEVPQDENYNAYLRTRYPDLPSDDSLFHHDETIYRYEIMDEDLETFDDPHRNVRIVDAAETKLHNTVYHPNDRLRLNYDFGDNWWVSVILEKIFEDKELPGSELPRVVEGAGFGIVEDAGGVGGLEDLAKAFKKKKGAEYKQFSEWLGVKEFDMTAFDLDDMNFRLKKIPRIYKQCYEDRLYPTQKSIDLIERKYLQKKL
ncbi:MAG TPA: plasmid pRiA4b ORF-3 family protein [Clostridiales bacterium]|nr:plasmid pRiA4b ORF-3 family protein [Clostridiales bacterium]